MPNANSAAQNDLKTPNEAMQYDVSRADLPVHCPMPGTSLWNSHPKVYIPVAETGSAKCPYCGAEFHLLD